MIYKIYVSDYTFPIVTTKEREAKDVIRTAQAAGKDVRWVRMTVSNYIKQIQQEVA